MNCQTCQTLLIDYHGGELDRADGVAVAAHLSSCPDCAVAYCRLDADLAGLGEALEVEPSPATFAQLQARVEREFGSSPLQRLGAWLTRRIPLYQAVLAVFIVVFAGALAVTQLSTSAGDEVEPVRRSADAQTIYSDYDGSDLLRVAPNVL